MRLIPRPTWARLAAARLFELDPHIRRLRTDLRRRVGSRSVVEIGCGFGANARHCAGPYLGLDADAEVIAAARRATPGARFEARRVTVAEPAPWPEPPHTALLCLVLHEAEGRDELLAAPAVQGVTDRVLVYDYAPDLGAVGRFKLGFLEPPCLAGYWSWDLPGAMADLGWGLERRRRLSRGPFQRWEFQRATHYK